MKNYIGQLRLYSLLDLVIFLYALHTGLYQALGAVLLWLGFILYLEYRHGHSYRKTLPNYLWVMLTVVGFILFQSYLTALAFIVLSHFYTLKKSRSRLALLSPVVRGAQAAVLVIGIIGYHSWIPLLVWLIVTIRNFLGDIRDAHKDTQEGKQTLAAILHLPPSKYIHLVGVLITTSIAWYIRPFSVILLLLAWLFEIASYNWTPR